LRGDFKELVQAPAAVFLGFPSSERSYQAVHLKKKRILLLICKH